MNSKLRPSVEIVRGSNGDLDKLLRPLVEQTAEIARSLAEQRDTWVFEHCEQTMVGAFCAGAARAGMLPCIESTYHQRKNANATHKRRIDLWLDMDAGIYFEFKLKNSLSESQNLNTAKACATKQLNDIKPFAGEQGISVVVFCHGDQERDGLAAYPQSFGELPHELVARFRGKEGQAADAHFERVWPCSQAF